MISDDGTKEWLENLIHHYQDSGLEYLYNPDDPIARADLKQYIKILQELFDDLSKDNS